MREPDRERLRLGEVPFTASPAVEGLLSRDCSDEALSASSVPMATPEAAMTAFAFSFPSRMASRPSALESRESTAAVAHTACTAPSPIVPFCIIAVACAGPVDELGGCFRLGNAPRPVTETKKLTKEDA